MVKNRKQIDGYSVIVAIVFIVAIVILISNSGGSLVGENGFRFVPQSEVPTKDKVFVPSLPFTLWDQFINSLMHWRVDKVFGKVCDIDRFVD